MHDPNNHKLNTFFERLYSSAKKVNLVTKTGSFILPVLKRLGSNEPKDVFIPESDEDREKYEAFEKKQPQLDQECLGLFKTVYDFLKIEQLPIEEIQAMPLMFGGSHSCGWGIRVSDEEYFIRFNIRDDISKPTFDLQRPDVLGGVETLYSNKVEFSIKSDDPNKPDALSVEIHPPVHSLAEHPAFRGNRILQKGMKNYLCEALKNTIEIDLSQEMKETDLGVVFYRTKGKDAERLNFVDSMDVIYEDGVFKYKDEPVIAAPYLYDTEMLKGYKLPDNPEQRNRFELFWINEDMVRKDRADSLNADYRFNMGICYLDYDRILAGRRDSNLKACG